MITLEYLINESYYYWGIMPFLTACCCVLINRLALRQEDSCPTQKDKLQMGFIYFACVFVNMFFIWLLMLAQEAWLAQHWNINI